MIPVYDSNGFALRSTVARRFLDLCAQRYGAFDVQDADFRMSFAQWGFVSEVASVDELALPLCHRYVDNESGMPLKYWLGKKVLLDPDMLVDRVLLQTPSGRVLGRVVRLMGPVEAMRQRLTRKTDQV
jgi:hypothetical protein